MTRLRGISNGESLIGVYNITSRVVHRDCDAAGELNAREPGCLSSRINRTNLLIFAMPSPRYESSLQVAVSVVETSFESAAWRTRAEVLA